MNRYVIPLRAAGGAPPGACGGKAVALARLIESGARVPGGFCITADAYRRFVDAAGLSSAVALELGRKRLDEMRWEELWDAALRIRNLFLAAEIPGDVRDSIAGAAAALPPGIPLAVRSASLAEDAEDTSFAGLHESFLNVRGTEEILRHVRLVWASLWSDASLSYRRELSLDPAGSAMSVVAQEMILGDRSGVAFSVDPGDGRRSAIEAVYGLNAGLVDGDVEPDRWLVDRSTGAVVSSRLARHDLHAVPGPDGVRIAPLDTGLADRPVLSSADVDEIFAAVMRVERLFGSPQDVEWTFRDDELFLLQARPITTARSADADARRSYDLSLRRSFENLSRLRRRLEDDLVPAMIREAADTSRLPIAGLDDDGLAGEIERRREALERWNGVYWDEFIPFGHGVRLFGQVYNDRIGPDDPFEFVDLLAGSSLESVKRNRALDSLARRIRAAARLEGAAARKAEAEIERRLERLVEEFRGSSCSMASCGDEKQALRALAAEMASGPAGRPKRSGARRAALERSFLESFGEEGRGYASELLDLARASYRLRDDDNIYLGRFESNLVRALEESRRRLGARCPDDRACNNPEEVVRALRFPGYAPRREPERETAAAPARARQLRGQPAGAGIARGAARVVLEHGDLFGLKRGEILVCDAIDPNMTFVVPLAAGIVERRGGMLIHGAIIAREYGLPCVTGVPDATTRIATGDELTVDGYYGLVVIHRPSEDGPSR